jgi:hypothetical protein
VETSNWRRAICTLREGFLLTRPRSFSWSPGSVHYVDYVPVSEAVYDLAYAGELQAARALWLEEFERA